MSYIDNPRLDSAEAEVILIISLADGVPMVEHPSDLDSREVR